jgi:uncharacterized membrane protein YkoI
MRTFTKKDGVMVLQFRAVSLGLVVAAAMLAASAGVADPFDRDDRHDHDAARIAVERGEIRPLAELLTMVRDKLPGEITGVEIERRRDSWVYEFRVIDKAGRLFEVYVDAKSGDIKRTKEK